MQEALAERREVHVEHHDDEKEEHRDRAHIDDHQDHRQELGPHQQEQARRIDEGQDEEEHRLHGIAGGNHHEAGGDRDGREQVEEGGGNRHVQLKPPEAAPSDMAPDNPAACL